MLSGKRAVLSFGGEICYSRSVSVICMLGEISFSVSKLVEGTREIVRIASRKILASRFQLMTDA